MYRITVGLVLISASLVVALAVLALTGVIR